MHDRLVLPKFIRTLKQGSPKELDAILSSMRSDQKEQLLTNPLEMDLQDFELSALHIAARDNVQLVIPLLEMGATEPKNTLVHAYQYLLCHYKNPISLFQVTADPDEVKLRILFFESAIRLLEITPRLICFYGDDSGNTIIKLLLGSDVASDLKYAFLVRLLTFINNQNAELIHDTLYRLIIAIEQNKETNYYDLSMATLLLRGGASPDNEYVDRSYGAWLLRMAIRAAPTLAAHFVPLFLELRCIRKSFLTNIKIEFEDRPAILEAINQNEILQLQKKYILLVIYLNYDRQNANSHSAFKCLDLNLLIRLLNFIDIQKTLEEKTGLMNFVSRSIPRITAALKERNHMAFLQKPSVEHQKYSNFTLFTTCVALKQEAPQVSCRLIR